MTQNDRKTVVEFEVVDHGIEHSQYFSGCGLAFTDYEGIATGCGNDAEEAMEDALEQLATDGWNVEDRYGEIMEELGDCGDDTVGSVVGRKSENHEDFDGVHYYVSIRVK